MRMGELLESHRGSPAGKTGPETYLRWTGMRNVEESCRQDGSRGLPVMDVGMSKVEESYRQQDFDSRFVDIISFF